MKKILLIIGQLLSLFSFSQTLDWTKTEQWSDCTQTDFISNDNLNNVYIAGGYGGCNGSHYLSGSRGACISKYDPQGTIIWTDTMNNVTSCYGIALDTLGNFYSLIYHNPSGNHFVKYNTNGIKLLDVTPFGGGITGKDIQVGLDGYIYLTGEINYSAIIGTDTLSRGGFITKFNSNGQIIWTKHFKLTSSNGTDCVFGKKIRFGKNGIIYLLGAISGNAIIGSYNLSGYYSSFLASYHPDGTLIATSILQPGCSDMAIDNHSRLYFTGEFGGSATFGSNTINQSAGLYWSYFVAAKDDSGWLWATELPDIGRGAIDVDLNGNVYCMGNGILQPINKPVYNLVKLDSLGNKTWSYTSAPGSANDFTAFALHSDGIGDLYVGGKDGHSFLTKFSSQSTGLIENSVDVNALLMIYPNPTKGLFQVNYSSNIKSKIQLNIINSKGEKVYEENISQNKLENKDGSTTLTTSIDLSKQAKGVYFIEIIADRKKTVKKIVLN